LPAMLISGNARLARCSIRGIPTHAYASGSRLRYELRRGFSGLKRLAGGKKPRAPLEDWATWFAGPLYPSIRGLLSDEAAVLSYASRKFVRSCLDTRDPYWLGKLVTMELVLRLSDAGWRRIPLLREH
jgi:hypothetical protein